MMRSVTRRAFASLALGGALGPLAAADLSGWFEQSRKREGQDACAGWIAFARQSSDPDLLYRVGLCYSNGWGVPEDRIAAEAWLRRAADRGQVEAQVALADAYLAAAETRQAYRWYAIAAEGNYPGASIRRDRLARLIDPDAAETILREARAWRPLEKN